MDAPRASCPSPGCLEKGPDVIPIPGTKKIEYLKGNWAALGILLDEQEVDRAVGEADVEGGRYPEVLSRLLFGEMPEE